MPDLPSADLLLTSLDDGVLHLTINRPDRRNALSRAVLDEMEQVLVTVAGDPSVRAIVLRGAQGIFCAGGDLKDFGDIAAAGGAEGGPPGPSEHARPSDAGGEPDRAEVARMNRRFGDVFELLLASGAVIVAVVEKAAIGGGFGLAAIADVVLAEPNARFAMTETSLGLVPAQIAPIVARRLGVVRATTLAVTGQRLTATEAVEQGLVDRVADDLDAALAEVLAGVRRCAPQANAATKALMRQVGHLPLPELLDHAAEVFTDAILGPEAQAGIGAFLQKTSPPWAGEA